MKNYRIYIFLIFTLLLSCTNSINLEIYENNLDSLEYIHKYIAKFNSQSKKKIVVTTTDSIINNKQNFDIARIPSIYLDILHKEKKITQIDGFSFNETIYNLDDNIVNTVRLGNNIFGFPETMGNNILFFYNSSLIKSPPVSSNDLMLLLKKDQSTFNFNYTDVFLNFVWVFGFTGTQTPKINFKNYEGEIVNCLSFLQNLKIDTDYKNYSEIREGFLTNKIKSIIDYEYNYKDYKKTMGENLAVSSLPIISKNGKKTSSYFYTSCYVISPNPGNKKMEIINDFFNFIFSDEIQGGWIDYNKFPVKKNINITDLTNDQNLIKIQSLILSSISHPGYEYSNRLSKNLTPNLNKFYNNKISPIKLYQKLIED